MIVSRAERAAFMILRSARNVIDTEAFAEAIHVHTGDLTADEKDALVGHLAVILRHEIAKHEGGGGGDAADTL